MPRPRAIAPLLALLLSSSLLSPAASAATPACGTYRGTGYEFVVENATQARTEGSDLAIGDGPGTVE